MLALVSCQEANPDFDGPAGSGSASEGSTTGVVSTTTEAMTTTGVGGTSSTSIDPDTSGSSGPGESTSPGSSGSGGDEPLYPPCMLGENPECVAPYDQCYDSAAPEFTGCTLSCVDDGDCPQPVSGDVQATCGGQGNDECMLDCSGGATCPDGMECVATGPGGMSERCLWPS